jgi:hypothetical protein
VGGRSEELFDSNMLDFDCDFALREIFQHKLNFPEYAKLFFGSKRENNIKIVF